MINALLLLFFLHFLCDFALQSNFLAEWKGKNYYIMFVHCFLWTGGICLGLHYLGIYRVDKFAILFGGHFICDTWKARGYYKKMGIKNDLTALYIDQTFHAAQLLVVYYL